MDESVIDQDTEIVFGGMCFICGQDIHESGPDPLRVTIEPTDAVDGVPLFQVFWCHTSCFRHLLHMEFVRRFGGIGGEELPPGT